jgi:hypothetical protein
MSIDVVAYTTKYTDDWGDIQFKSEIAYLNLSQHLELYPLIKELAIRLCDEYTGCDTYEFNMIGIARIQQSYYTTEDHEVNDFLDIIIRTGIDKVFIKII